MMSWSTRALLIAEMLTEWRRVGGEDVFINLEEIFLNELLALMKKILLHVSTEEERGSKLIGYKYEKAFIFNKLDSDLM